MLNLFSTKSREPAECIIRIGNSGMEITDLYPLLLEVTIDTGREEPAIAALKFETRRDNQGMWTVQDAGIFAPWEPIVIEASFGTSTQEIMRGFIREIRADYPENAGDTIVTVECQDESIRMDREHKRLVWGAETPTNDREIVTAILGNHGMVLDSSSGAGMSNLVINQDDTDISFLHKRAEANGYDLLFQGGMVYFGPMRLDAVAQETIMVYAGQATNCLRFNVRDDGHQADRVIFNRPETKGAGAITELLHPNLPLLGPESPAITGGDLPDFAWRMTRQDGMSEEEWTARAQRRANELSLKIKAAGELDGSLYGHVLRVGEPVGVDGVGDRYGGIYFVDRVLHVFSMEGYRQSFHLLRNAYGDNLAETRGLLAGVLGG
jgi:hypothetical protein